VGGFLAGGGLGMYTTTKFAVVAYSEALAAELAPSGIGVSVLCPSLTRTNLMDAARNRPGDLGRAEAGLDFLTPGVDQGMDADQVGRIAVRGIREDALWIFTDGSFRELVESRFAGVSAALKRAEEPA
jgi:short-subunit dehydrogenase